MAKSREKLLAREMRKSGESVKVIAGKLGVSKSSASIWCRDIELTPEQIQVLESRVEKGSYAGRLLAAHNQRDLRLQIKWFLECEGKRIIGQLTKKELLMAGLGLYIGEGTKDKRVVFSNSDPVIIKFMIRWFQEIWGIAKEQMYLKIGINEVHRPRQEDVAKHWETVTGIPREQFQGISFIKSATKKVYANHFEHYGTVQLGVYKSANLLYEIKGLIHGLLMAG